MKIRTSRFILAAIAAVFVVFGMEAMATNGWQYTGALRGYPAQKMLDLNKLVGCRQSNHSEKDVIPNATKIIYYIF